MTMKKDGIQTRNRKLAARAKKKRIDNFFSSPRFCAYSPAMTGAGYLTNPMSQYYGAQMGHQVVCLFACFERWGILKSWIVVDNIFLFVHSSCHLLPWHPWVGWDPWQAWVTTRGQIPYPWPRLPYSSLRPADNTFPMEWDPGCMPEDPDRPFLTAWWEPLHEEDEKNDYFKLHT